MVGQQCLNKKKKNDLFILLLRETRLCYTQTVIFFFSTGPVRLVRSSVHSVGVTTATRSSNCATIVDFHCNNYNIIIFVFRPRLQICSSSLNRTKNIAGNNLQPTHFSLLIVFVYRSVQP